MNKLLEGIRFYADEITAGDIYHFFASKAQKRPQERLSKDQIIYAGLYRKMAYPGIRKGVTLFVVKIENTYLKEYGGHGLATALAMLQFLFAFYKFGCTTLKTSALWKGRKGEMYRLLGMKKIWIKRTFLYFIAFISPTFFFKGKYDEKAVDIIRKNQNVKTLCKNALEKGVTIPEVIKTYQNMGNKLAEKGFYELGNILINASKKLEKKTS